VKKQVNYVNSDRRIITILFRSDTIPTCALSGGVSQTDILGDLCSGTGQSLVSLARYGSSGLSPASGFEHPASTLPTRFPAALGIGHGLPAA